MNTRIGFCCKWLNDPSECGGMKVNAVDRDLNGRSTTMRWLREHASEADQRQWDIMNHNASAAVKMIDDIEDNSQTSLDEDQLEEIADDIYDEIRNTLRHMSTSDIVDTDTAEFSLYDKTIELDSVEIDTDSIADTVIEEVKKVMWDKFLPKVAKQEVVTA